MNTDNATDKYGVWVSFRNIYKRHKNKKNETHDMMNQLWLDDKGDDWRDRKVKFFYYNPIGSIVSILRRGETSWSSQ